MLPPRTSHRTVAAFTELAIRVSFALAVLALAMYAVSAGAFPQYSQNKDATYCAQAACHGDFRANNYVSLHDAGAWGSTLMDGHKSMLDNDCDFCHSGAQRFPVVLNSSNLGLGCVSCHGRLEPAAAQFAGSGLRQHHYRSGVTVCLDCHADANPADFLTAPEAQLTPFQQRPAGTYTSGPNDPCNGDGSESLVAPSGLDNDGDLAYDGADTDCTMTNVLETPVSSHVTLVGVLPNPISSTTRNLQVAFTIPRSGPTTLELFDIRGRLVVRRHVPSAYPGRNTVNIESPRRPFSGVYLLRLTHGGESVTKKVVLLK